MSFFLLHVLTKIPTWENVGTLQRYHSAMNEARIVCIPRAVFHTEFMLKINGPNTCGVEITLCSMDSFMFCSSMQVLVIFFMSNDESL